MRYNVRPSKKFQKDIKRLKRRGLDMSLLDDVIEKLAGMVNIFRERS